MTDVSSHITTDPVDATTCDQCGAELDVSGVASFTEIECPNCKAQITVPARLGSFRLLSLLGQGGMGAVYRGVDTSLDRPVAVKVLLRSVGDDPHFIETFQKEAKAAAALNHPNIVQIYQFGREKGQPYIAMELLMGGRLDKMIAEGKLIEAALAITIAIDVAQGLMAAGDIGLIHGDVKPENILLDKHGTAKIVDFGLAAYMDSGSGREGVWGTPYYIAPEKVRGKPGDVRSDIYSLGATLFHALTLKPPFEGKTAIEVVKARLRQPAPAVNQLRADVHSEVVRVVQRMLDAEPTRRYPTYTSLIADLRSVAEKIGPPRNLTRIKRSSGKILVPKRGKTLPASPRITASGNLGKTPKKRIGGRRIAFLFIILLGIAGAAVGWWQWQEMQARRQEQARQRYLEQVADKARLIFVELDDKVDQTYQRLRETYPLLHSATAKMKAAQEALHEVGITNRMDQVVGNMASVPGEMQQHLEEAERAVGRMRDQLAMVQGKRRDIEDQHTTENVDRLLAAIQARAAEAGDDKLTVQKQLDTATELHEKLAALDNIVAEKKEQFAEAERQRLEAEQRQRELEAQRQAEAEREREVAQKVAAEHAQLDAVREKVLVKIRSNDFRKAASQVREIHDRIETEEARETAETWIERLDLLPEMKEVIIDQLAKNGYPWGWLGQRDIIGADMQFVHLQQRKVPWHEVPPRQILRFINHYTESNQLDSQTRAQFNLAAAAYCYENNALPLALIYAHRAIQIQNRLKDQVERIMPDIEDL